MGEGGKLVLAAAILYGIYYLDKNLIAPAKTTQTTINETFQTIQQTPSNILNAYNEFIKDIKGTPPPPPTKIFNNSIINAIPIPLGIKNILKLLPM